MQHRLDYRSPDQETPSAVNRAMVPAAAAAGVVVLINLAILMWEASSPGFGSIALALTVNPIANGTLIIIGLARSPFVDKRLAGASLLPYLIVSIVLPVAAGVFNYAVAGAFR